MVSSSGDNSAVVTDQRVFDPALLAAVQGLVCESVREGVPASSLTTFAVGGALRALVTVNSEHELKQVISLLASANQPVEVFGFGSNLLVSDYGLDRWVIKLGAGFRRVSELGAGRFELGGAVSLMSVARRLSGEGFSGLEFAAGIPASLGGAVFMNAGAHGAELAERIVTVKGCLASGQLSQLSRDELPWSYRFSGLPKGFIVTGVELKLVSGDLELISGLSAANLAHRKRTQPLTLPSAGSVFKNPTPDLSAGKVLEAAGVKGLQRGGAKVSELHANWIVNPDKRATAENITQLISECQRLVFQHSGIELEPEVRLLSD